MAETDGNKAAWALRRAILGDAYVDAVTGDADPIGEEFQEYLTSTAWGVWARQGALSLRDRSLLVMAMTAALGRMEGSPCTPEARPTRASPTTRSMSSCSSSSPIVVRRQGWRLVGRYEPFGRPEPKSSP